MKGSIRTYSGAKAVFCLVHLFAGMGRGIIMRGRRDRDRQLKCLPFPAFTIDETHVNSSQADFIVLKFVDQTRCVTRESL